MTRSILTFIVAAVASYSVLAAEPFIKKDYMVVYKKQGAFKDTKENISNAITGRGLVINNVSHIGEMLERTGKDLGKSKQIYLHAESLSFCSASVSRDTMAASPHNIVFCPYILSVYEVPSEPGISYVSYRRPKIVGSEASKKALMAVEELLDGIAQEALSW